MREQGEHRSKNHGAFAGYAQVGGMLGHSTALQQSAVFELLQRAQQRDGQVSGAVIRQVAETTSTSEAMVRGVASFYSLFETSEQATGDAQKTVVRVCDGPTCCLLGGQQTSAQLVQLAISKPDLRVERTSCLGLCERAPALLAGRSGKYTTYGEVPANVAAERLFTSGAHVENQLPAPHLLGHVADPVTRPLTARFGAVDPRSIDSAIAAGAYLSLKKSLDTSPAQIIDEVESSGLRGRGGAGFVTGKKWRMAASVAAGRRVVVCNADESEPGTFKDRMLMENDPHLLLEGMAICGHATGANEGYIYIRGEYVEAAEILEHAIVEARAAGWLGKNIGLSTFDFDVHLHRGAGAYICGEETALLESLEGKRGEPRERPPYPTTCGYRGLPTIVNNVETFCAVPSIISHGHTQFRDLGRDGAFGTKLFCLSGHIARPGMCEAPSGTSLRELIEQFGQGLPNGSTFKFALTGGAAGTFVDPSMLDLPMRHASWADGLAVGSGAVIVADSTVNAAEMLRWVLHFFEKESCGKCTPCRIGTTQARQLVDEIRVRGAADEDIERLMKLARMLDQTSLCGLGQSVAWPIESAIKHFRSDFSQPSTSTM